MKTNQLKALAALAFAATFAGCQVSYVRPSKGDMAGNVTVYQGFSRSAVGESNEVDAASTKTSAILTASINPELNSEINPALSSEINPALASEINPSVAGNSAEINPEIATEVSPELELSDISDVTSVAAEDDELWEADEVEAEAVETEEAP